MDITEIDDFDNLHQPEGILADLQREAAALYGAEESFFLVNGSTCGLLSAISAALPEGGHILMARNCHKSVYHGAYLRKLKISYLYPPVMKEWPIADVITPEQVEIALRDNALSEEPRIGAVLVVSPTYEGRIADIAGIAEVAHGRGIPLIVDEAHGAHLGFAEGFAQNSARLGADLVIHSVHKTLPAMTQTALLHRNGELVDRDKLRRFLRIFQTSSPSYVLMASIDNALQVVRENGEELFSAFRNRYTKMLDTLQQCDKIEVLPMDAYQDVGKLVISGRKGGISGKQLYDTLRETYGLQTEMAAGEYCLVMFTVADTDEAYERMTKALCAINDRMVLQARVAQGTYDITERVSVSGRTKYEEKEAHDTDVITFALAWDRPTEWVTLEQAIGRCAGDFVNLYPPGIPLLVPGERMTRQLYDNIVTCIKQGLQVQGVEMFFGNRRVKVVRE